MEKEHCPPVSLGEKHRTRHYERCSREHDVQSELSIDVEMYESMDYAGPSRTVAFGARTSLQIAVEALAGHCARNEDTDATEEYWL